LAAARDIDAAMNKASLASDESAVLDFDPSVYAAMYPDLDLDPDAARAHYLKHGRFEGRYPSKAAIEIDRMILLSSGLLDDAFYRTSAGLGEGEDPARHYLIHGTYIGLEPGPAFEGSFLAPYFKSIGFHGPPAITYALLQAASWAVYPTRMAAEEIAETISASELFDAEGYRAFLGVENGILDPALHYILVGERYGFRPSEGFDPDYYGEQNADVLRGGVCFLAHYLKHGRREGRRALPRAAEVPDNSTNFAPEKETIILVSHEASRTGAPIVALNIGRRLCKKYNVITLLLRGGDLIENFGEISAQVICLHNGGRMQDEVRHVVTSILRKRPIRYVIFNSIARPEVLASFGDALLPTVALIHEFASYSRPLGVMREALGWVTEPVFSTKVTADSFSRDHPALLRRRLHIVPQGHCRLATATSANALEIERRRLQAAMRPSGAEDALVVLGCGTVHLRKGVDLFLATAAAVQRLAGDRKVRFVWIGHGYDPERDLNYSVYLAEQLALSGLSQHVVLMDEVTDLEPAYAMADLFLLASRLDPLPNVTVDATMRGLPVICFEGASGIAEILQRDATAKQTVVPYLDTEAAARQIVALMNNRDLRARIGEATRALAQATFDMDRYIVRIDEVGAEAIEATHQRRSDFETLQSDRAFDAGIISRADGQPLARDAAIMRFLATWSAARTAPYQIEHLDLRRPCAGFNPQIYAHHHPEVLEADVNPFADFIRKRRPEGPWLHPVIRPDPLNPESGPANGLRTAIHGHFHYPELIYDFLGKLSANRSPCDLLLSTNDETKAAILSDATRDFQLGSVDIRLVPNRGRDLGPLLSAYGEQILQNYDIVCHLHSKRSLSVGAAMGEIWREFLWQHLIGDLYPMMDLALSRFAMDPHLGLLFPEDPHLCDWAGNLQLSEKLATRLGVELPLPPFFEFPVGTMFWCRPRLLAPLVDLRLSWDDYPEEPVANDGTILHALERLLPFLAAKEDLSWVTVHIPGVNR
jgi:glycosyltransferase involved in cell wall biosynthesis